MEAERVEVDGELFDVRVDQPGHYHFDWISGPNPGYGFSSATSDGSPLSTASMEESIRSFLKQVDLTTGYIE
ncbi:hypothetical protein GCM10009554_45300 [Kribbella koreensis]|uniref:Uncharacterized protein n=1 Tax=Kribbella koreensis TaxID=57909 RepID=A0ABN1QVP3_9ACTN